jgi:hypothetical protein
MSNAVTSSIASFLSARLLGTEKWNEPTKVRRPAMLRKMSITTFGNVPAYGKFILGRGWIKVQLRRIIEGLKKQTNEQIMSGDIGIGRPCYPGIKMDDNCWAKKSSENSVKFCRYNARWIVSDDNKKPRMAEAALLDNDDIVIFIGM